MSRKKRNRTLKLAVLALGVSGVAPGWAAVTPGGDTNHSSWDALVGNTGVGTLRIDAGSAWSNQRGMIGNAASATGTVTVTGAGSIWANSNDTYVGYFGNGTLNIEDGGQVASTKFHSYIGYAAGSVGTATVTGVGSLWTSRYDMVVGEDGHGALSISGSGKVSAQSGSVGHHPGASGTATVSGPGSMWINSNSLGVGGYGSGSLTVQDGGQVSGEGWIGSSAGSIGTVTLNGAGSKWLDAGTLRVGHGGNGTLNIERGAEVDGVWGYIGYKAGSTGVVTVSGAGAGWSNTGHIDVGTDGSGVLRIENGGQVSSTDGYVGSGTGSSGIALITGAGSTWTMSENFHVGRAGQGTLKIENAGQVSNTGIAEIGLLSGSNGVAAVSGNGAKWTVGGEFYVGQAGNGSLSIGSGGRVSNTIGHVGYSAGSVGTATVSGAGSNWSSSGNLYVGNSGSGSLEIRDGGQVSDLSGYIGFSAGSAGAATVTGAGSVWSSSSVFNVGSSGSGTLTVADGGKVTARIMSINSKSIARLHVSGNDMLVLGLPSTSGTFSNNGSVSLFADALLPAGTYRPISAYPGTSMSWSGSSNYKPYGGTWSSSAKTFTVLAATALSAGESDTVATGERLLFADSAAGQRVGASFGAITGSVSFSATPMSAADLAGLVGVLEDGRGVLTAWDFTTNFSGGEAMLSFDVGTGAEDLAIWHFSGGVWSEFTPSLFTYDSHGIASFTVSSFSGYAVTAAVPEPGALTLLALAGSMLLARRRTKA